MKGVIYILANATAVTDLLANGASSIFEEDAPQGENIPYLIMSSSRNPTNTYSTTRTDDVEVGVFTYATVQYTSGSNIGRWEISRAVRSALESASAAVYDGDNIAEIYLQSEDGYVEGEGDNKRYVQDQKYSVFNKL